MIFFWHVEVIGNKWVVYEFGKFVLDPKERTLLADGVPIHLRAKEFDTLLLLVEHNGHLLTKEEMMAALWQNSFVEESNLARQISQLRKIFNTDEEQFIETLPKHGYRFTAELRRTIVEPEDEIVLEKRTVKRVTFAIENELEAERLALPPAKKTVFSLTRIAVLLLIAVAGVGLVTWYFVLRGPPAVDPYAPVRLTDNPLDDTAPSWTREGRIRFYRILPDNHVEVWSMQADGSGQEPVKMPDGKRIFIWSPDGQKIQYVKNEDNSRVYLSNADGSGERQLPFRGGGLSADSKLITYHQRLSGDNFEIFTYAIETGEVRNVTNHDSFDADPSFSPDGKRIVFASSREGNAEIYSINIDGTDLTRLTNHPGLDAHAAYSPDGTQIMFGSVRENENGDIYLMNADGSGIVKLFGWDKANETVGPGGWSTDGTKIVFYSDRNGNDDLYIVNAETVRPRLVHSDPDNDIRGFSFSPDAGKIVYSREMEDKTGELRMFDSVSGRTSLIRKTELPGTFPDWSPDGALIAYHDRIEGSSEICVIKPDGSGLRTLTSDLSQDAGPAWSPDGKRLAYTSASVANQLYIMNADGSDPRPVTPRKAWENDVRWWPDGSRLIFACDRTDSPGNMLDICEINTDGGGERRVLFHRMHDASPVVSPDGKRIAFVASSDGNREIYLMNSDGSGLVRLTRNTADDHAPKWSPGGKKLMFISDRGGTFAIYEVGV